MSAISSVAVVIPTYARGDRVLETLRLIARCDPQPTEVWIHIDASDGILECRINEEFPSIHVVSSTMRVGPGGGRHRCLQRCNAAYAASFDDDSYPIDADYFARAAQILNVEEDVAVLEARIWHRNENVPNRNRHAVEVATFTGCGHVMRLSAYRQTSGYIDREVAYSIEEVDISLRLFANGWRIIKTSELRVFHDTDLAHHERSDITAATIANIGLLAFLRYPVRLWGRALLQLANWVWFAFRRGRWSGVAIGIMHLPIDCWNHRMLRNPIPAAIVRAFLERRRLSTD